jgi:hypothetical protein
MYYPFGTVVDLRTSDSMEQSPYSAIIFAILHIYWVIKFSKFTKNVYSKDINWGGGRLAHFGIHYADFISQIQLQYH